MATIHADGFDHYTNLLQMWDSVNTPGAELVISSNGGRFGGGCLKDYTPYTGRTCTKNLPNLSTIYIAFAFYYTGLINSGYYGYILTLYDGATLQTAFRIMDSYKINCYQGATNIWTTTRTLSKGVWHWLEFKLVCSTTTTGTAELMVDGDVWGTATVIRTVAGSNAYINGVRLGYQAPVNDAMYQPDWRWDDFIINDSGYIGDHRIITSFPNANGSLNQWTPSAGSNYQCVDEMPPDDDASYVSDSTVGDQDRYTFPGVSANSILSAVVFHRSRKDDAGTRSTRSVCKSGATTVDNGTDFAESTSYVYHESIYDTDPNTGAPWTPTNLSNAEFGVKVTA